MKSLLDALSTAFAGDGQLMGLIPGGLTHGTVRKGKTRPRATMRVLGGDDAATNTSQRYQREAVRVLFIVSCVDDATALSLVDLMEKRLPGLVTTLADGRVHDCVKRGSSVDEMPDEDGDAATVWEGSLLLEYQCTRDRLA